MPLPKPPNQTQPVLRVSVVPSANRLLGLAVALLTAGAIVGCSKGSPATEQPRNPVVILEATETLRGIAHYEETRLVVRLTDNGKVEWDELGGEDGRRYRREATSISPKRVMSISQDLSSVDLTNVLPEMGPYIRYVDTSVELRIRMASSAGERAFSVMNWSCQAGSCLPFKQSKIPSNLLALICQIYALRSELAHEPTQAACNGGGKAQE